MSARLFAMILLCSGVFSAYAADSASDYTVGLRAEQWDTLRHGEALLKQSELAALMQRWMQHPASMIELRYPGGEEGEIWVHDVIDWLVALGVPSAALQAFPGSGSNDTLYLVLLTKPDR